MYNPLLSTASNDATVAQTPATSAATELEALRPPQALQSSSPLSPFQSAATATTSFNRQLSPSSPGSPHCRYCLGRNQSLNYSEVSESLIGPCRCKGSVGLVHPGCLMHWLAVSRKHRCELCGFDLRQCERLALLPRPAEGEAADAAEAEDSATTPEGAAATVAAPSAPVATCWSEWLRQGDQACCLAMTASCLLIIAPLIGVLTYFVTELRAQSDAAAAAVSGGGQDYQIVLFELLTGFVTVAVLVWLIYVSVRCASRYRAWRGALLRRREATTIVALEEA